MEEDKDKLQTEKGVHFPEAPASVTYDLQSPAGFGLLFTVRGSSGFDLLAKMPELEDRIRELQYVPKPARSYGGGFPKKEPNIIEGKKCPKCGMSVVKSVSRKTGKSYEKCSTAMWDPITQTSRGCDHFEWIT